MLEELWSGKPPAVPCPAIKSLVVEGKGQVSRGENVRARVTVGGHSGAVQIAWVLCSEQANYGDQGTGGSEIPSFPEAIQANGRPEVVVTMPKSGGIYRLVLLSPRRPRQGRRRQPADQGLGPRGAAKTASGEAAAGDLRRRPEGHALCSFGLDGNAKAVQMEADCTEKPRSGPTA